MTLQTLHHENRLAGRDGPGPATPTLQALWQEPMKTIFAGGPWKEG
jgi:hypothetical protein